MELLTVSQMLVRLMVALALGVVMGFEREVIRKDAGIKTSMLVAGGACLFTLVAISIPYLMTDSAAAAANFAAESTAFNLIANIVVGIGFIGGGIIMKENHHVQGLTTAALIWSTAGIGILAGLGLWQFATLAALLMSLTIYLLRVTGLSNHALRNDLEEKA